MVDGLSFFFFSSRRRHTRSLCDWSSDVCSSDLSARVIDRSVRPLFPEGFKNEVQVFVYVLSADQENDADVLGVVAASTALSLSKVPWNGPIAAVRVGRVEEIGRASCRERG